MSNDIFVAQKAVADRLAKINTTVDDQNAYLSSKGRPWKIEVRALTDTWAVLLIFDKELSFTNERGFVIAQEPTLEDIQIVLSLGHVESVLMTLRGAYELGQAAAEKAAADNAHAVEEEPLNNKAKEDATEAASKAMEDSLERDTIRHGWMHISPTQETVDAKRLCVDFECAFQNVIGLQINRGVTAVSVQKLTELRALFYRYKDALRSETVLKAPQEQANAGQFSTIASEEAAKALSPVVGWADVASVEEKTTTGQQPLVVGNAEVEEESTKMWDDAEVLRDIATVWIGERCKFKNTPVG